LGNARGCVPRVGRRVVDIDLRNNVVGNVPPAQNPNLTLNRRGGVTVPLPRHILQNFERFARRVERVRRLGQTRAVEIFVARGPFVAFGAVASAEKVDFGRDVRGGHIREGFGKRDVEVGVVEVSFFVIGFCALGVVEEEENEEDGLVSGCFRNHGCGRWCVYMVSVVGIVCYG